MVNVHEQTHAKMYVSQIVYVCDLLHDAPESTITLGTIAEVVHDHGRALAMAGRIELTGDELARVARRMRNVLARPFDGILKSCFDWAWGQTAGLALARLADRYSDSLVFSSPIVEEIEESDSEVNVLSRRMTQELHSLLQTKATTLPSAVGGMPTFELAAPRLRVLELAEV